MNPGGALLFSLAFADNLVGLLAEKGDGSISLALLAAGPSIRLSFLFGTEFSCLSLIKNSTIVKWLSGI